MRYDNGELVTKNRMEDEDWYYNLYQPFLEFVIYSEYKDVDTMYKSVFTDFKEFLGVDLKSEKERILRWCVLHTEREKSKPEFVAKILNKLGTKNKE